MLTARPDLNVRSEKKQDDRVDFLVGLKENEDVPTTKHFVVQVKGTLSPDKKDWIERVSQLYRMGRAVLLPACVFIVNVRNNDLAYAYDAMPRSVASHAS